MRPDRRALLERSGLLPRLTEREASALYDLLWRATFGRDSKDDELTKWRDEQPGWSALVGRLRELFL